ncbi:unnamed protein product [Didymodactylos carnosus]|uniref:Uncharacterized protein n=1 Tax=Didymodactylos carnosus TaxID=1234261 RepID=A0A8S2LAD6_9BILA|nr:unnamed protein product [Didymodactylos carnosus]CAF3879165.1 unnamed protein product [Didymodactylos carnosus]
MSGSVVFSDTFSACSANTGICTPFNGLVANYSTGKILSTFGLDNFNNLTVVHGFGMAVNDTVAFGINAFTNTSMSSGTFVLIDTKSGAYIQSDELTYLNVNDSSNWLGFFNVRNSSNYTNDGSITYLNQACSNTFINPSTNTGLTASLFYVYNGQPFDTGPGCPLWSVEWYCSSNQSTSQIGGWILISGLWNTLNTSLGYKITGYTQQYFIDGVQQPYVECNPNHL